MLRIAAVVLLLAAGSASAQVYKCETANGRLVYSDRPCETAQKQTVMADKTAETRAVELVARCDDPMLAFEAPNTESADVLSTRDERMTAGQAHAWNELRYGQLSAVPATFGFHRSGTLHVCAGSDAERREFVILPDGRAFALGSGRPVLQLDDAARAAQNSCGAKLRSCAESSTGPLDTCIRSIPACETGDPDCCPGECLSQFRCWSNRAPSPIEAYKRTFGTGCPAAESAERCM